MLCTLPDHVAVLHRHRVQHATDVIKRVLHSYKTPVHLPSASTHPSSMSPGQYLLVVRRQATSVPVMRMKRAQAISGTYHSVSGATVALLPVICGCKINTCHPQVIQLPW